MQKEDKAKIAARCFYADEPEQYEDFKQAYDEMRFGTTEGFLDTVCERVIEKKEGHRILMSDEGHVVAIRTADSFVEFRTEMTEEEAKALAETTQKYADENPQIESASMIFINCGWKLI